MSDNNANLIAKAEAEIADLERLLESRREALAWLRVLVAAPDTGARVQSAISANAATARPASKRGPDRKDTWTDRIDRVLRDAFPSALGIAEITRSLVEAGYFESVDMKPRDLVRAYLSRARSITEKGWTITEVNGSKVWTAKRLPAQLQPLPKRANPFDRDPQPREEQVR